MRKFTSILIANRGEIAVRVMRTAQALGYRTIAVYSAADAQAPHVRMADDAVLLGPPPVAESYLHKERILAAARKSGAEAIHPGYGFLAENAGFAGACEQQGLVFIGPSAEAIDLMGNKAAAKRRMIAAEVPCVPGYEGEDQSDEALLQAAHEIGYPLLVKAAAGGGGRGMRLVAQAQDVAAALNSARSEALNAFGSDELILEQAILRPRHVEVQIFADVQGNTIHLGERDCSVQRRYQKVVEEAPCPVMNEELRQRMGAAAVAAARSINYCGAGTVEFLLDAGGKFYFLEMNTRLQVEHPVTEMITGLDLVALQIQVARGQPLGLSQEDITLDGHAIEVRVYAEDPAQDFLPVSGAVNLWRPAAGDGVRIDAGIETGSEISPFYDPMLAKVMAWGGTREIARQRLIRALQETTLFGLNNNKGFLIDILQHDVFVKGEVTTAFIGDEFSVADLAASTATLPQAAMTAVIQFVIERQQALAVSVNVSPELLNWSSSGLLMTRYVYDDWDLTVTPQQQDCYVVRNAHNEVHIELLEYTANRARLTVDGRRQVVFYSSPGTGTLELSVAGRNLNFRNHIAFAASAEQAAGGGQVLAPMHGALLKVLVGVGDRVTIGTRLAVLEAMKMQHDLEAEINGTVVEVLVTAGNQVAAGELLIAIGETNG